MELDIHEGKRVLYKHKGQWAIGYLTEAHNTILTDKGLYLSIIPVEFKDQDWKNVPYIHDAELNDIFLDAFSIPEGIKSYKEYFMSKEEYIQFIESEDFDRQSEIAYVSDGEYGYYRISKYTKNWIEKQPFDYVVRMV